MDAGPAAVGERVRLSTGRQNGSAARGALLGAAGGLPGSVTFGLGADDTSPDLSRNGAMQCVRCARLGVGKGCRAGGFRSRR